MHKQTKSSTKKNKVNKDEMEIRYMVSFMYIKI
jgi:hypothetical protein